MRVSYVAVLTLTGCLVAACSAGQEASADDRAIDTLLAGMAAAMEGNDTEAVMACFSDHYLGSDPGFNKGQVRKRLQELFACCPKVTCRYKPLEKTIRGNRALVVADWEITVRPPDAAEVKPKLDRRKIHLTRGSEGWRIVSSARLATDTQAPEPGQEYALPAHGVKATVPKGWRVLLVDQTFAGGAPPALELVSEDLRGLMSFGVHGTPGPMSAQVLADVYEAQMHALVPDVRVLGRTITEDDARSRIGFELLMPKSDFVEFSKDLIIKRDQELVIFSLSVADKDELARYRPAFEKLVGSYAEFPRAPVCRTRGALTGTQFANDAFGCRVRFPGDWSADMGGALSFFVTARSPDKRGTIMFGGLELPEPMEAGKVLDGDDAFWAQMDATFQVLERSPASVGGLEGAQSFSLLKIGESRRKRWRLYLMRDQVLYLFLCDASPPEAFEEFKPTFEKTVGTLEVSAPAKQKPPALTKKP